MLEQHPSALRVAEQLQLEARLHRRDDRAFDEEARGADDRNDHQRREQEEPAADPEGHERL